MHYLHYIQAIYSEKRNKNTNLLITPKNLYNNFTFIRIFIRTLIITYFSKKIFQGRYSYNRDCIKYIRYKTYKHTHTHSLTYSQIIHTRTPFLLTPNFLLYCLLLLRSSLVKKKVLQKLFL